MGNKAFVFNGQPFMKIVPSKRLFRSTLVHDVVTRGDIFAVNLTTGEFTVFPGSILTSSQQQVGQQALL